MCSVIQFTQPILGIWLYHRIDRPSTRHSRPLTFDSVIGICVYWTILNRHCLIVFWSSSNLPAAVYFVVVALRWSYRTTTAALHIRFAFACKRSTVQQPKMFSIMVRHSDWLTYVECASIHYRYMHLLIFHGTRKLTSRELQWIIIIIHRILKCDGKSCRPAYSLFRKRLMQPKTWRRQLCGHIVHPNQSYLFIHAHDLHI